MKKPFIQISTQRIDRSKSKSIRWSINLNYISIFLANLIFILYMVFLYLSGFFIDWEELITEPYLMLRGLKSYTDIATQHAPLFTEFLTLIYRFFGTNINIRILLLIFASSAISFLTFFITYKFAGKRAALFSILLLAIFWPFYGGTNFWFDTFLPIFYLVALILIIDRNSSKMLFIAGMSMGISFLIKQISGAVALVICIMLLVRNKDLRSLLKDCLIFSVGILVPIVILAFWLAFNGQFSDACYWVIKYNLSGTYTSLGKVRPPTREIIRLIIAIIPIILVFIKASFSKAVRKQISWNFLFVLVVGFFASFTIFPRWERWHVAPAIPFLLISLVLSCQLLLKTIDGSLGFQTRGIIKTALIIWIVGIFLNIGMFYPPLLIEKIIPNFSRLWPFHSYNPPKWVDEHFIRYMHDIPEIGKYIHDMTTKDNKIFVWGWMGERIYRESGRLPAGKFYYALPWFTSLPRFNEDLLMGFERYHPRFVIVLKRPFPKTPTLLKLGIDLEKRGYHKLSDLEERFPEVVIWKLTNSNHGNRKL